KWAAYVAAVGTGIVYVALLAMLWLYVDLMVYRGQLPTFHELSHREQDRFIEEIAGLEPDQRAERMEKAGIDRARAEQIAGLTPDAAMDRDVLDRLWRGQLVHILEQHLGTQYDFRSIVEPANYDDIDHGVLSLIVRAHTQGSRLTPVIAWLARWNTWMWNLA